MDHSLIPPVQKRPNRWVEGAKITLLLIVASVIYGIAHDQVTARIYLPYFNAWPPHAQFFQHPDPTIVGLYWGVVATWWVGLIAGILVAWVSLTGEGLWWTWRHLLKPVASTFVGIAAVVGAWFLLFAPGMMIDPAIAGPAVTPRNDFELSRFSIVYTTHTASYICGAAGSILLAVYVWRKRHERGWLPSD